MRCITLTQPWATLVAIGAKKIETRSWLTSYRGPLAIHAAKGLGPVGGKLGLMNLCRTEPFRSVLVGAGYLGTPALPLGAIVAVCELGAIIPVESVPREGDRDTLQGWTLTDQERAFGDYTPGRYAWLLADVKMLAEPIPCKGALSLWEPDLLTQLAITRQQIGGL